MLRAFGKKEFRELANAPDSLSLSEASAVDFTITYSFFSFSVLRIGIRKLIIATTTVLTSTVHL